MENNNVVHGNYSFEKFRRKLADVVTVAINGGRKVTSNHIRWSNGSSTGCPLGCIFTDYDITAHGSVCPVASTAAKAFDILCEDANAFINGFSNLGGSDNPYYKLGRIYNKRFP